MSEPSPVEWTPDALRRFWDWEQHFPEHYFTNKYGAAIARLLRRYVKPGQHVLDYGCGMGFLSTRLARDLRAHVWATDASAAAIAATAERNAGYERFHGTPEPGQRFDRVIAIEVIEHLDDAGVADFFGYAGNALRPGSGRLVLTTPNREDLFRSLVRCPHCDHTFHRWQHVRSLDAGSLRALAGEHGFRTTETVETDFARPRRFGPRRNRDHLRPHLVAVLKPALTPALTPAG